MDSSSSATPAPYVDAPLLCCAFLDAYGSLWPRLSGHEGTVGVHTTEGH